MLIDKICGLRLFNNPSRNKSTRKARFRAAQTVRSGTTAQPQELSPSLMVFTGFLSKTICVSHSHLCSLTWVSGSNQDLGHWYWAVWLISISYPHQLQLDWHLRCSSGYDRWYALYLSLQNMMSYICPLQTGGRCQLPKGRWGGESLENLNFIWS